jgi:transcriptional regulator with XRE-family HTH domain
MTSKAPSLGQFVADLMIRYDHTNRSLAAAAGVSESAIRNMLKFGVDKNAKDPDARTLSRVAKALDVDAIRLFRLAGYIPPEPAAHSVRADYLAETFDELSAEKQDAVLGVLEAMTDRSTRKAAIQSMRSDSGNALAGLDLTFPHLARLLANQLIVQHQLSEPHQVDGIAPDTQVLQYRWGDLPVAVQERVKALIRHKLSLDYDPIMVDPEWRS